MSTRRQLLFCRVCALVVAGCAILAMVIQRNTALGALMFAVALFIRQTELVVRIRALEEGAEEGAERPAPSAEPAAAAED